MSRNADFPRPGGPLPDPHPQSPLHAGLIGIDWGTTNRRGYLLDESGRCVREATDDQGMLSSAGRFECALHELLEALRAADGHAPVLMSGMVGARQGWREARYLSTDIPLTDIGRHLTPVTTSLSPDRRCAIVPGYCWRDGHGGVDVLRGEETQLLGAVHLGRRDGWFLLPGTHSKWVLLRDGRIAFFATYLTGELFALLQAHGTLAPLMGDAHDSPDAFARGVAQSATGSLSQVLFGARARVVADDMPATDTRSYLSGLLIGAEWHDMLRRAGERAPRSITLIGSAELGARHTAAGVLLDVVVDRIDPRDAYLAALAGLAPSIG